MRKPQVRPPRTPRGEDPRVTIANLENHVTLLTKRCEDLVQDRDRQRAYAVQYCTERDDAIRRATGAEKLIDSLNSALRSMAADVGQLRGYQERVREEDRNRYGDLPK